MKTISQYLSLAIEKYPDRTAIFDSDNGIVITYRQMAEYASAAAAYLEAHQVQRGDFVVLAMGRSVSYILAEVTCLLYGFGAVLMDSSYPESRILYAKNDTNAKIVLDDVVAKQAFSYSESAEIKPLPNDCPAIAIYTSGSTGKPKGILHSQRSIAVSVLRNISVQELTSEDITGLVAPMTFVVGCTEICCPLCVGASAVLLSRSTVLDVRSLSSAISNYAISVIFIPPGMLRLITPESDSLRLVYTASEKLVNVSPNGYKLLNIYGQSETAGGMMYFDVDKAYDNTPIGKPMDNASVYLLDEKGNLSDEGEICVCGDFMVGYIGRDDLTADTKVNNPFFAQDGHKYMLRTGDMGKWLDDGNLLYLNRKDWMLKINGNRVEPGEIETIIRNHPYVDDAVVCGFTNQSGVSFLCAYYVKTTQDDIQSQISDLIRNSLPAYMMPSFFIELDSLPRNANGKIDRMSLQLPKRSNYLTEYNPPANELETTLCNLMQKILDIPQIGIDDDFFLLGGDSLCAMQLTAEMNDSRLDLKMIYEYRTPATIASAMESTKKLNIALIDQNARSKAQKLTPYQLYYLDYQLYSSQLTIANIPYMICMNKQYLDTDRLIDSINKALSYHPVYSTVFSFNEEGLLIQQIKPEVVKKADVYSLSEHQVIPHALKHYFKPFKKLLNAALYRCAVYFTEKHIFFLLDIHHIISDGSSLSNTVKTIFKFYADENPEPDYYYAFLEVNAIRRQGAKFEESEIQNHNLHEVSNCARYPLVDRKNKGNTYNEYHLDTEYTVSEIKTWCSQNDYSITELLTAAGSIALSRYNNNSLVSVEILYNGRNENWKLSAVGNLLSGIPVSLNFESKSNIQDILDNVKKQYETGIRQADYSFAIAKAEPISIERMRIIYECGIGLPDNVPADTNEISLYNSAMQGNTSVFQILAFEGNKDDSFSVMFTYNGELYTFESLQRFGNYYIEALNKCLIDCPDNNGDEK